MTRVRLVFLVSFLSTDFDALKSRWRRESTGLLFPADFNEIAASESIQNYPGVIQLLDWSSKTVEVSKGLARSPTGICVEGPTAFVCTYFDVVNLGDDLVERGRISSRLMNDLHSIELTRNGFLLASSGIDAAIECDRDGNVTDVWCAADHGFATDCFGNKRTVDLSGDYRGIEYHTRRHSSHINSCHYEDSRLYLTLFHQGLLLAIDRSTGAIQRTLPGLLRPHSVRSAGPDTLVVSNTCCGRVVFVDHDLAVKYEIGIDSSWIQDALVVGGGEFLLISDNDHNCLRLVGTCTGEEVDRWSFDPQWRVFAVAEAPCWC